MKKFMVGLGALTIALALTACGGNDPAPPTPPPAVEQQAQPPSDGGGDTGAFIPNDGNPATINISWWGNEARAEAMENALDIYRARYPHITINSNFGAFGGWLDALTTQLTGNTEPDIMQVNYAWIHSFGRHENAFLDLNTVSHIIDLTQWTPDMLNFMTVHGEVAGVPHGMNGRIMVYNRPLLQEAGFNQFPRTFDELLELGTILAEGNTNLDLGNNTYAFLNLGQEAMDIIMLQMLYNMTGRGLQTNGQINYTVEEVAAVFDIVGQWRDANVFPTFDQQDPVQNESNPVWTSGRAGSSFEWVSNAYNQFAATFLDGGHSDQLGIAVFPNADGNNPATMQRPSLGHAISRNSSHPEVAAHILNFLYTDEAALVALGTQLGVPVSSEAARIAQRDGTVSGMIAEGMDILNNGRMGVMDAFFEDPALRQPRFAIVEAFRMGIINSTEAAERYVNEQQAALNQIFN